MFCAESGLFGHHLSRTDTGTKLEGTSRRYTAIVLLALAHEDEELRTQILDAQRLADVCDRLISGVDASDDPGDVALTLWAARAWRHPDVPRVLQRLRDMLDERSVVPTVDLAWALSAVTIEGGEGEANGWADALARRLLTAFEAGSDLFGHVCGDGSGSEVRRFAHVACFADQVYPIQALSCYYRTSGYREMLEAATRCAKRICALQGEAGQWWWHYDIRTGRVIEGYPVYAIHQDAMGPMALFALDDAGGGDFSAWIARGLAWLIDPPEIANSLIDWDNDIIWRKVGRNEPGKLSRGLQAAASGLHPSLRAPATDWLFPANRVDYESRPYHMGWMLYAWPVGRTVRSPMTEASGGAT